MNICFSPFQECNDEPVQKCENKVVKIPKQEKEHKKKCLLTHDNALPKPTPLPETYPTTSAPSPDTTYATPENTYTTPHSTAAPTSIEPTEEPLHPLHPPSYHATKAEINMYNHYIHKPQQFQGA